MTHALPFLFFFQKLINQIAHILPNINNLFIFVVGNLLWAIWKKKDIFDLTGP